jgi:hypothetical protein
MSKLSEPQLERTYRVALLRSDEAAQLTRDAQNQYFKCCPHLDIFHTRGDRRDGSHWRTCNFFGCQCDGEDTINEPHVVAGRASDAARRKYRAQQAREQAFALLLIGAAIGAFVGWWLL